MRRLRAIDATFGIWRGVVPLIAAVDTLPYLATRVSLVAVETGPEHGVPVVAIDQHGGARLATQHLLTLGHHTVHHIAGPPGFLEANQRLDGWRDTLQAAGAPIPPVVIGDWSARSGYEAGKRLLENQAPTAIFSANDQMTLGVLRALKQAGLRVPDDVSLIGFDDVPEAAYFDPPLTTIRQDFGEVGHRGLQLLLDQINSDQPTSTHETIEPELVIRESTGPPPPPH